jgi:hypothetical protein
MTASEALGILNINQWTLTPNEAGRLLLQSQT